LRRELRQLEQHTAALELSLRQTESTLQGSELHIRRLEEDLSRLTAARLEAEKNAALADAGLAQIRGACSNAARRLASLEAEARVLEEERQAFNQREADLHVEFNQAALAEAGHKQDMSQATDRLGVLRIELEELTRALIPAQARVSGLEERRRAEEAERVRLLAQANETRARLAQLAEQGDSWHAEEERLKREQETLHARLAALEQRQQVEREALHSLETESQVTRCRREELRPRVEAARMATQNLREKRSDTEVALARAESDLAHMGERCRAELRLDPAALLMEITPDSVLAGERLEASEQALRELAARLESVGPVNMMALEELQEAEERCRFLETQRQDLLVSIQDTTQAIREIDHVSRQQFDEAFTAINGYFAETFRMLFGGGVGEMRLSDESDEESGLDVVAQPPGKRLQNVLLLSGGEKALAALALLLAIFRYRPSPFCVLDEVDAPLDESNIERFARLVQQLSRHTQFILMTHNKQTMEISQVMYGVTMEEPGVSRIVSVRFDRAELVPSLARA